MIISKLALLVDVLQSGPTHMCTCVPARVFPWVVIHVTLPHRLIYSCSWISGCLYSSRLLRAALTRDNLFCMNAPFIPFSHNYSLLWTMHGVEPTTFVKLCIDLRIPKPFEDTWSSCWWLGNKSKGVSPPLVLKKNEFNCVCNGILFSICSFSPTNGPFIGHFAVYTVEVLSHYKSSSRLTRNGTPKRFLIIGNWKPCWE